MSKFSYPFGSLFGFRNRHFPRNETDARSRIIITIIIRIIVIMTDADAFRSVLMIYDFFLLRRRWR